MIIDQGYPGNDPMVLTGSHNWSASADSRNDENTLIIHDATLANIYYQEFAERFSIGTIIGTTSIDPIDPPGNHAFMIYPNPSQGRFNLVSFFRKEIRAGLETYSTDGRLIWSEGTVLVPGANPVSLPTRFNRGIYILQIRHPDGMNRMKLIIR
jgi:hypothetical protein